MDGQIVSHYGAQPSYTLVDAPYLHTRVVGDAPDASGVGEMLFARSMGSLGGQYGNWGTSGARRMECLRHYRLWNYIAISFVAFEAARYRPNVAFVHPQEEAPSGPQTKAYEQTRRLDWSARQRRYTKSLHQIQPHEDITPAGPNHPINLLFDRPNAWDRGGIHDVIEELIIFLRPTGDGYLWAVPDRSGRPCELWVIPSHWVQGPRLDKTGIWYYPVVPVVGGGAGMWSFPADEIIHFHYKNPRNKLTGLSPLNATSEWTDIQDSINFSQYAAFKNGCFPTGVLELDPKMQDPGQPELERIYAKFFSRIQGESRFGRPIVLAPGMKFNPLNINPTEMAYLASADKVRDNLLSLHGVPKELLGITDVGAEIAMYGPMSFMCRFTIGQLHARIARVLTHDLARRYDDNLRIWWDDVTPDNPEQVGRELAQDMANGTITMDEYRAVRGRQPYDIEGWSDKPLVAGTLVPLGEEPDMGMGGGFGDEEDADADLDTRLDTRTPAHAPGSPKPDAPGETGEDEDSATERHEGRHKTGVRPEVVRALVAVSSNGHADSHGLELLTRAEPVAAPTVAPVADVTPAVAPAAPAPRLSRRRKRLLSDLLGSWARPEAKAVAAAPSALDKAADAISLSATAAAQAATAISQAADRLTAPPGKLVKTVTIRREGQPDVTATEEIGEAQS